MTVFKQLATTGAKSKLAVNPSVPSFFSIFLCAPNADPLLIPDDDVFSIVTKCYAVETALASQS